jgi:hypothetical protein
MHFQKYVRPPWAIDAGVIGGGFVNQPTEEDMMFFVSSLSTTVEPRTNKATFA